MIYPNGRAGSFAVCSRVPISGSECDTTTIWVLPEANEIRRERAGSITVAGLRLIEHHQLRRTRRKQSSCPKKKAQRPIGELGSR